MVFCTLLCITLHIFALDTNYKVKKKTFLIKLKHLESTSNSGNNIGTKLP